MIEGSIGRNYKGDIAIDDVDLLPITCPPPASCSFETGMCGYSNSLTDDMDWIIGSAVTPSWYFGPKTDHTTNVPAGMFSSFHIQFVVLQ